jgi:flagellar hook assembly protein FlgD
MSGFNVAAPLLSTMEKSSQGQGANFKQFMNQTYEESIDMVFKIMIAEAQSVLPGDEGKGADVANSLLSVAGTIQHAKSNHLLEKSNKLEMATYVASLMNFEGREVEHESDFITYTGQTREFSCALPPAAAFGMVRIADKSGRVIREFELDGGDGGPQLITWDGKDMHGDTVKNGSYFLNVLGYDEKHNLLDGKAFMRDIVDSVAFDESEVPHLMAGGNVIDEILNYRLPRAAANPKGASVDIPL